MTRFTLDGREVEAAPGETLWQVAKRLGTDIPHLCHRNAPGYRSDGNCRACMVEVAGERTLTASCTRLPTDGMVVTTSSARATRARRGVMQLLAANMPARGQAGDGEADFWHWMDRMGVAPRAGLAPVMEGGHGGPALHDASHPAMVVNLDACIRCGLCVRACREVQMNDVLGMAGRGAAALPVFDFADPMGDSTCVACGECVQACPTGALLERSLTDDAARARTAPPPDKVVDSVCPYCGVGCLTSVSVKDGQIQRIDGRDGPANENRLCVKGRFGFDYISHPGRLTRPLIRRADAPKDASAPYDPANWRAIFREAEWEEALDLAASGLKRIHDAHGGGALAGFGSAKGSNEEAYLFQKLIRQGFGTNNVDHCTRLCHASSVAALLEGVGSGAVTAPFDAAMEADCVIIIGARPAQNHPVAATYFKQAAKRGAKLVVMDPRRQDLMRFASHALVFRPGSDVALLNAMLNVIISENLYDPDYIAAHVDGFETLRARIAEFTPEAMQPVCGIPPDTIREVARLYATSERSIIFWGMGVSQHTHGTDNVRCLIALALVTGQIGRAGTGLHPLRGQNNVQGASDAGLIPMMYPDYRLVEDPNNRARYEDVWGRALDPVRGLTVVEVVDAIHDGQVRGMYIMGENPAMSDPDQQHARAALAALEHLAVQDIFLTETAWLADVVLPASAHAEKLGSFTNTNRQVQLGRPAVPLPVHARQDLDLIIDLARRIGLDWTYGGPQEVFAEMAALMPSLNHITWERLEAEGSVTYPVAGPGEPGQEILFGHAFPREGGRARIVPAELLPPDEVPDAEFPLVLTTGRVLEHWHTGAMTRRASALDAIEPEPFAALNPRELMRRGAAPGDPVRVITRRGTITAAARADRDVPEGLVFVPFCYFEAAANVLTNPKLDPYGKIPEFKYCAARVEMA